LAVGEELVERDGEFLAVLEMDRNGDLTADGG
jgi:hypothetical protein